MVRSLEVDQNRANLYVGIGTMTYPASAVCLLQPGELRNMNSLPSRSQKVECKVAFSSSQRLGGKPFTLSFQAALVQLMQGRPKMHLPDRL